MGGTLSRRLHKAQLEFQRKIKTSRNSRAKIETPPPKADSRVCRPGRVGSQYSKTACGKPPEKRYTASSPPNEHTLRSVERSYAQISIYSHLSVNGVKIADFASNDENDHSASAPSSPQHIHDWGNLPGRPHHTSTLKSPIRNEMGPGATVSEMAGPSPF